MGGTRSILAIAVLTLALVVGAGAAVALRPPSIPAGAASQPVGRAVLEGPVTPDPTAGPEPTGDIEPGDVEAPSPAGFGCVGDITRGSGSAHLCWEASRFLLELDPDKDYYVLKFHGSFVGLRWLIARARLVGTPGDGAFDGWPASTFEGACREEPVDVGGLTRPMADDVCGRTEGVTDHATWTHSVTWTCEQCLVLDADYRAVSLYTFVGVPEGQVPSWDLFLDAGT